MARLRSRRDLRASQFIRAVTYWKTPSWRSDCWEMELTLVYCQGGGGRHSIISLDRTETNPPPTRHILPDSPYLSGVQYHLSIRFFPPPPPSASSGLLHSVPINEVMETTVFFVFFYAKTFVFFIVRSLERCNIILLLKFNDTESKICYNLNNIRHHIIRTMDSG